MSEETKNVIVSEITCPECSNVIVIERPAPTRRGQLLGLSLENMTIEQLKREKVNASSVLYKATKRNAPIELIAKNQARVDAVNAELASRAPVAVAVEKAEAEAEAVYADDTASEI